MYHTEKNEGEKEYTTKQLNYTGKLPEFISASSTSHFTKSMTSVQNEKFTTNNSTTNKLQTFMLYSGEAMEGAMAGAMDLALALAASTVAFMASLRRALARILASKALRFFSSGSTFFFSSCGGGLRFAWASGWTNTPRTVAEAAATAKSLNTNNLWRSRSSQHSMFKVPQMKSRYNLDGIIGPNLGSSRICRTGENNYLRETSAAFLSVLSCWQIIKVVGVANDRHADCELVASTFFKVMEVGQRKGEADMPSWVAAAMV